VYKLTCPHCSKAYIGQTGRIFSTRFKEHKQAAKNNTTSSNFAKHINEHAHSFRTIDTTMSILKKQRKGPHLNTLERFYIHKEAALNKHLNDQNTITPNKFFDTILKMQPPTTTTTKPFKNSYNPSPNLPTANRKPTASTLTQTASVMPLCDTSAECIVITVNRKIQIRPVTQ
jgi:hypothetical protein